MAIQFKKQIAKAPAGNLVSPGKRLTRAEEKRAVDAYKKTDHYKQSKKK